jgi:hypothetical protein
MQEVDDATGDESKRPRSSEDRSDDAAHIVACNLILQMEVAHFLPLDSSKIGRGDVCSDASEDHDAADELRGNSALNVELLVNLDVGVFMHGCPVIYGEREGGVEERSDEDDAEGDISRNSEVAHGSTVATCDQHVLQYVFKTVLVSCPTLRGFGVIWATL